MRPDAPVMPRDGLVVVYHQTLCTIRNALKTSSCRLYIILAALCIVPLRVWRATGGLRSRTKWALWNGVRSASLWMSPPGWDYNVHIVMWITKWVALSEYELQSIHGERHASLQCSVSLECGELKDRIQRERTRHCDLHWPKNRQSAFRKVRLSENSSKSSKVLFWTMPPTPSAAWSGANVSKERTKSPFVCLIC